MDLLIEWLDNQALDAVYSKVSPDWLGSDRYHAVRQFISIYMVVAVGGALLYFSCSGLSWFLIFDKTYLKHVRIGTAEMFPFQVSYVTCILQPKFLKNQVRREISTTVGSIPFMTLLTAPIFLAEVCNDAEIHAQFKLAIEPYFLRNWQVRGYSKLVETWGSWQSEVS
jgi:Delta7-sterol 5-desaturase